MLVRVLGSVLAVAALAACQKALTHMEARPLSTLAGTEWGPAEGGPEGSEGRFVAFRPGGEIAGSGGCNNFFGTYEQQGRLLTVGALASTKKACPGPLMQAERDFLDLLSRARSAEATWKELTLYGEQGEVLATLRRRDWD